MRSYTVGYIPMCSNRVYVDVVELLYSVRKVRKIVIKSCIWN